MQEDKGLFDGGTAGLNIKDQITKHLARWPLFLISLFICLGAGLLYTRYTPPKYMAYTSFLIKGNGNGNASSSEDLIESALNGKREINLNNEILVISSSSLMERVVAKYEFNINYYKQGKILKTDIYLDAPFRLVPQDINDSSFIRITLINLHPDGGNFLYGANHQERRLAFKWNKPFTLEGKTFILVPQSTIQKGDGGYEVTWQPIGAAAAELSGNLSVNAFDAKTSVIQLDLLTENLQKGKAILDALFNEFNLSDIEDRNKLSENTVRFIDERLNMISGELKGVEGNLENYRGNNQLINVEGQSAQSLESSNNISKIVKDINIQQGVVSMISNYFNNPVNKGKLVPSSLGLNDPTLSSLIAQYNGLQLKKEREAPMVAPNSIVMQDLNNQSNSLKSSILESLQSISKNLRLQENNQRRQNSQYRQFLSSLPRNERVLQEIKRKQSITEGLYLYLLQKREEAAISSTSSSLSHYKQLDPAKGYGPVEPNTRNILIYTALLGLFLPFGWIYLESLFNDKVNSQEDVSKVLYLPIVGEISHVPKKNSRIVVARSRDLMGEQFRIIRTNLSLFKKKIQVILITSSVGGEGKSFISINLASVMAIPGKKVALLELDLRKPSICDVLHLDRNTGITQYLSGEVEDITELYRVSEELPTLHIYPSGPLPANPADVLLNEKIGQLFAALKQKYDYLIIDTAPAGLVSDAFVLGEYSDAAIYVIRQRFTTKNQLSFIKDINAVKKLCNIGLILNDVKSGGKYGNSGYYDDHKNGYYGNALNGKKVFTWKNLKSKIKV